MRLVALIFCQSWYMAWPELIYDNRSVCKVIILVINNLTQMKNSSLFIQSLSLFWVAGFVTARHVCHPMTCFLAFDLKCKVQLKRLSYICIYDQIECCKTKLVTLTVELPANYTIHFIVMRNILNLATLTGKIVALVKAYAHYQPLYEIRCKSFSASINFVARLISFKRFHNANTEPP